ncbi:type II secretion system protein [Candidatus Microgenomates bacterium]|nr:type II secretion system protein [Candidatus Microgenomates bacterium]
MHLKGFTLIELLVVIGIMGVLATIGLNVYPAAQKQVRDVQRRSDLSEYRKAVEAYANGNNNLYPSLLLVNRGDISSLCSALTTPNNYLPGGCLEDLSSTTDSTSTLYYRYNSNGSGGATATKYYLYAKLEGEANKYWFVCSTGKSGKGSLPSNWQESGGNCPI